MSQPVQTALTQHHRVPEAGGLRSVCQNGWLRALFQAADMSSHGERGLGALSRASFIRAPILMRAQPYDLITSQSPHLLLTSASLSSTCAGVATTELGSHIWQQSLGKTWGRAQRNECFTLRDRGAALCPDTESSRPSLWVVESVLLLPGLWWWSEGPS